MVTANKLSEITAEPGVDLAAIKARQQKAWASGDYSEVGSRLLVVSELLCDAVDLRSGERVLDVATGTGNAALAAARRFCTVTGIDYVPELLERARRRADAEGLEVEFEEGDAENIPFPDESFDVVLSSCGAMFAPNQEKTASELLRVCRPGGRIGMVNWTPEGFVGEMFRAITKHVPPPPGLTSPLQWGTHKRLRELFGPEVRISGPLRSFLFRFPSDEFFVDFMARYYGPTLKAFEAVGIEGAGAFRQDLLEAVRRFDASDDETLVLREDYLEVVIRKG